MGKSLLRSRRSHMSRYGTRRPPACRWGRWWAMQGTATSAHIARSSKRWSLNMWSGLGRPLPYGTQVAGRCRPKHIGAEERGQLDYSVARVMNRYRSRIWRWHCQSKHGAKSHGARYQCCAVLAFCAIAGTAGAQGLPAHRPYPEAWLLIEWPKDKDEPVKYWLSNLSADVSMQELVSIARMRWRIERDYEELKQEFGLGHYEGRGCRVLCWRTGL
jgi:SRSO17 transposase